MKTKLQWPGSGHVAVLLLGVFLALSVFHAAGEIIPADRRVKWEPGVAGGIPVRTAIFADVTQAPYNANNSGAANAAAAIQSAINACPADQVVFLPAGTYRLDTSLKMKERVTLRGAGPRSSVLRYSGGGDYVVRFASGSYEWDFSSSAPASLTGGITKGSTNITANNNWAAGDLVLIDELEDSDLYENDGNSGTCTWCGRANGERCHSQIVEILSRTASSATINPPLYSNFKTASKPQGVRIKGVIKLAGIESLGITNVNGAARDTLIFEAAYKCWVKDCDISVSRRRHMWMYHSIWCEIRDSSFHHGVGEDWNSPNYGPDRGYGLFLGQGSTSCLIENNDFYKLHFSVAFEGGCSGNVISYNFVTNVMYTEGETPQPSIGNHGSHPMMNLWEGNVLRSKVLLDSYWGSSSHTTVFRNRISNMAVNNGQQALQYVFIFDIWKNNRFHNIVGNVLGNVGMETAVDAPDGYGWGGKYIYRIGFTDANDNKLAGNDSTVMATLLRHGNWHSVNQTVAWDPAISDRNLPASYYLSAKPAWWGDSRWPAIGPDMNPVASQIPAEVRHSGRSVVSGKPLPPVNLRLLNP